MSTEQMREDFEAWLASRLGGRSAIVRVDGGYLHWETEVAWQAWQASREALVVELPDPYQTAKRYMADEAKFANKEGIDECHSAIEAAGVRVK